MLSLAYALDLQADRAIQQAKETRRHRPANAPPGWEGVALGIAEMTQHRPAEALEHLEEVIAAAPRRSPIELAAKQWRTMALILANDQAKSAASLEELIDHGPTRMTALLWAVVMYSQQGQKAQALQRLTLAAQEAYGAAGLDLDKEAADLDDQGLYDAAIATVARGDLAKGNLLFRILLQRSPDAGDAPVWLALLAGAGGDGTSARRQLRDACQAGSLKSQALANHLLSVVYALEDRPDMMIQSILAGQRLLCRGGLPAHIADQPKPDAVWLSDHMK
jgi:tetratricopeptide (TPR) repeat protein